jgi:dihydrofolate reductase
MCAVVVDITMSLDGFVTGVDPGIENGLGDDGMQLHNWVFEAKTEADAKVLNDSLARTGAVVMGRNTFDIVDVAWNDEVAFGGPRDGRELPRNVVVTHEQPQSVRLADAFTFATDGVAQAVELAKEMAGDRDVTVMGGGEICRQCIEEGLADEIVIHLAPVLMGGGTKLFGEQGSIVNLEQIDLVDTPGATHLHYKVTR